MSILLWPLLAIWMGLALVIGFGLIGVIGWCAAHLVRDMAFGAAGSLWCPVYAKAMQVRGTPRRTLSGKPFVRLRRCEHWGNARVQCGQMCLNPGPEAATSFAV